jgi:hypothetical protein
MVRLNQYEFDGVMRKNLPCLMVASLNYDHTRCTYDEENHSYLIVGIPNGGGNTGVVYKFIYHLRRVTTAELDYVAIDQISDGNYNPIIKWNEELEQYDLCNRESDIPYRVISSLAFAMNDRKMVAHNSRNHQNPKEEKVMPKIKVPTERPKQKKKVYPNMFDHRLPGIAGIKDIQIHEKNGNTTTTVIWSDKDAKGRNKVTVVACCATEHPDTETSIAMAIAKRYFGGRNIFKRVAREANKLNNKRFQRSKHRASVKRKKKGEIDDSQ